MRKVLIVQPYVPKYRVALFEKLERSLAEHDVRLELVGGNADRDSGRKSRPHRRPAIPTNRSMPFDQVRFRGRCDSSDLGRTPAEADLVIAELGSGVLENYRLALLGRA